MFLVLRFRLLFVYINKLNDFSQLIINTEEYFGKETEVIRIKPEQEDELNNSFQSDSVNHEKRIIEQEINMYQDDQIGRAHV